MRITTYTNLFVNVHAGSTDYQVRAYEGVPVELDVSAELNNTEFYLRSAPWLQDLGDLSGLYLGQFEGSPLKRVRRLLIGSSVTGYCNTNFTQASFDNCLKLETLNLGGLINAKRSFDFSPNLYLKELYTRGSGVTGVTFARRGRLERAKLNAVKSLAMQELYRLTELTMPTFRELTSLRIGGCDAVDTAAMVTQAQGLTHVRLTGVEWSMEDASVLRRLAACRGWDDDGRETPTAVVTGSCHIQKLTQEDLDALTVAFNQLEITYGAIVPSYSVTFQNWDGSSLKRIDGTDAVFRVAEGGYVLDPVSTGLMVTPTRESDAEYHYTYAGWDTSLQNVTEDRIIRAVYTPSDRYYRVTWWADAAETKVNQEEQIIAHGASVYLGPDPVEDGKVWIGWDKTADDVVCDLDIHPVLLTPVLPTVVPEEFDYLYSDDPDDISAYTLAEFVGILESGRAKTYFQLGDRIKMVIPKNDAIADGVIVLRAVDYNHFRLADGSGDLAGVVFDMVGVMNQMSRMNPQHTTTGGWAATELRAKLNEQYFPVLPLHWQRLIRPVTVWSTVGDSSTEIASSADRLFLLSASETGWKLGAPYSYEVDPDAENERMPVFTDTAAAMKRQINGEGSVTCSYWTRSPDFSNGTRFIEADGSTPAYAPSAGSAFYVSWACCMGGMCQ